MGVVSPGQGRLRRAAAGVVVAALAFGLVAAATARPLASKRPVAKATCATLTLKKGGSGLLRLKTAKGSMPIASAQLAPGTKPTSKTRTIKPSGRSAFRYTLTRKATRGERVRVRVTFRKGAAAATATTVVCTVRIATPTSTVKVALAGDGTGTVSSAPTGMSCTVKTTPCARKFTAGATVKLRADPETSSTFDGWGGACSGTGTCVVKAVGTKAVTAKFTPKTFTVTIEKAGDGGGTISSDGPLNCGTTCSATFIVGTTVRLKAQADATSGFIGWTGECTTTVDQCTFIVDGDTTVTTTFTRKGTKLNVARAGTKDGSITADVPGIDCGGVCTSTYPAGTVVTLTATPVAGELFQGWLGDCSGSAPTCAVTMDSVKNVAATFVKGSTITVSVTADAAGAAGTVTSNGSISCDERGAGAVDNTCSALVLPDPLVTLTATPDPGSTFVSWDNCPNAASGNICQGFGSEFAATVVAHFTSP